MPNPADSQLFPSVTSCEWSILDPILNRQDLTFVDDLWHEFRPYIDNITDAEHKEFSDLIHVVCQFHLRIDSNDTFGPTWIIDGKRSPIPGDLAPHAVEVLASIYDTVPHLDLKARIGDVVWIAGRHIPSLKRRRFDIARCVVEEYKKITEESLTPLNAETTRWVPARDRLHRAAQIAREINQPDITKILDDWMIAEVNTRKTSEAEYVCRDILEVRFRYGFARPGVIAIDSLAIAERLHVANNHMSAEAYFDLAIRSTAKIQDQEQLKQRHRDCAKNHIASAQQYLTASPDAAAPAERHFCLALNHLRNAGAEKAETDLIQSEILRLNQQISESCGSISVPFDLTEWNQHLDVEFRDSDLSQSIFIFLFKLHKPKGYQYFRDEINRAIQEHPMAMMFPMSRMSHDGRVEAVANGSMDSNDQNFDGRLYYEVGHRQASTGMTLIAARRVFLDHCPMDIGVCERLAIDSPLVPTDRHQSVALALLRGWQGRWLESINLLIPQIENIIREILKNQGIVITKPNTIQHDYYDLGGLLTDHEATLAKVIGEGEALALRAACIERIAINRRNDQAHGLIPDSSFGTPTDVYLWWLFQRIIFRPLFFPATDT